MNGKGDEEGSAKHTVYDGFDYSHSFALASGMYVHCLCRVDACHELASVVRMRGLKVVYGRRHARLFQGKPYRHREIVG